MRLSLLSALALPLLLATAEVEPAFEPRRVVPPFPVIKDAPVVEADAAEKVVSDEELVLGLSIKGESRAYPIDQLTGPQREIINDVLGGQPVAATW